MNRWFSAGVLSGVALVALIAAGPFPSGGVTQGRVPFRVSGNTGYVDPSTTAQPGYMTTAQAIALASLVNATPTATPSPSDPLLLTEGELGSVGIMDAFASDTFTRANSANIAGTSVQVGGGTWAYHNTAGGACTPGIVSNQLKLTVSGACGGDLYSDVSHIDAATSIVVNLQSAAGDAAGPIVRLNTSTGNGYLVTTVNGNGIRIRTLTGWAPNAVLALYSVAYSAGDTVTVSASGTTISAYLNGTLLGSVTDSTYTTGTYAGVYLEGSTGRTFTNWIASTVPVPVGIRLRGYYSAGSTFADAILGENANAGVGGFEFSDTNSKPFSVDASQITSAGPNGTPPAVVSSSTKVVNWNADLLDGHDASYFQVAGSYLTPACSAVLSLAFGTVSSLDTVRFTGQTCTGVVLGDECSVSVDTALPSGAVLFAQGDGAGTVLVEAGCIKATGCTFAAQNTRVICLHH